MQVNGITMFIDCTNVCMQHHLKLYTMENIKKIIQYYQNAMPARDKGFHIYNEPPFFDSVWTLISPLLKEKTRNRMNLHGKTLATLYDKVDVSVLPEEYLPDDFTGVNAGTAQQIAEEMIESMMKSEFRSYIKDLTSNKYGIDLEMRKQSIPTVQSFRKLNID